MNAFERAATYVLVAGDELRETVTDWLTRHRCESCGRYRRLRYSPDHGAHFCGSCYERENPDVAEVVPTLHDAVRAAVEASNARGCRERTASWPHWCDTHVSTWRGDEFTGCDAVATATVLRLSDVLRAAGLDGQGRS